MDYYMFFRILFINRNPQDPQLLNSSVESNKVAQNETLT